MALCSLFGRKLPFLWTIADPEIAIQHLPHI
jgi:hypothetical protein